MSKGVLLLYARDDYYRNLPHDGKSVTGELASLGNHRETALFGLRDSQTYGANSSSEALKSGASCITPGCRGEIRRTPDFAPFTARAAAWQTFSRSQNSKGWSDICAASRTNRAASSSN